MLRQVHGVAASEEGGVALDDSPAADLVLSALKLADHPQHTAAGFHVANSCLGEHLGFRDAKKEERETALQTLLNQPVP